MNSFAKMIEHRKFTLLLLSLVFVQLLPVVQGKPNNRIADVMWGLVMLAAVNAVAENRRRALLFATIAIVALGGRVVSIFGPREVVVAVTTGAPRCAPRLQRSNLGSRIPRAASGRQCQALLLQPDLCGQHRSSRTIRLSDAIRPQALLDQSGSPV